MQNKFTDQARRVLEQAAFAAWTYTGRGLPGR